MTEELWISIDVETSGPTPSTGSLLAIGACLVERPEISFAVDFKPSLHMPWSDEAERIHGLSRRYLERAGREPAEAMRDFVDWVEKQAGAARPVFVAFNATFDWMWVADYAWRYVGRNPFGISGLDIKALYFGRHLAEVRRWAATTSDDVRSRYPVDLPHTHLALDDAREQAAMCRAILAAT